MRRRYAGYLCVEIGWRKLIGWTSDVLGKEECPYLRRHILWLPFGIGLRLHTFIRSDMDDTLHDHPWAFVTFPLNTYREHRPGGTGIVRGCRPHYRPAAFRHAVELISVPTRTIVVTGPKIRTWGFWKDGAFTPWRQWFSTRPLPPCHDGPLVSWAGPERSHRQESAQ